MAFNPLDEKGVPIEKQIRNWSEMTKLQYDKNAVDPYTRCRVIIMNGAEYEAMWHGHHMARHNADMSLKRQLAMTRRIEQQQQKAIGGLAPGDETNLEHTIGYEQVAVDLTAWLAQNEPDPYVKMAMDFGLLEDFDHLYRYANLMEMLEGTKAEKLVGRYTEITPGRPTISEHRHPFDEVRKHMDAKTASIETQLNVMTLVAAEQQTMNYYNNTANRFTDRLARATYTEIGMIEEQHVTHYESLLDPTISWCQSMVMHEYNECWLYWSFMQQEVDAKIKQLWELFLNMEITHLHQAVEMMKKMEGRDAREFLPKQMPRPLKMQSNIEYVRDVLKNTEELTAMETDFRPLSDVPKDYRYFQYRSMVNEGGVPTQEIIKLHIDRMGQDYRFETSPHPLERFQNRKQVLEY